MRFIKLLLLLIISSVANNFLYTMDSRCVSAEIWARSVDLHEAIFAGDCARVSKALIQGADANARYAQGMTPLLWAIYLGNIKIIKCLRAHGADINRSDSDGRTPLLCAILWGQTTIAKYLLECGADSMVRDCFGRTVWSVVVERGDAAIFEWLLCEKNSYAYAMILLARTNSRE